MAGAVSRRLQWVCTGPFCTHSPPVSTRPRAGRLPLLQAWDSPALAISCKGRELGMPLWVLAGGMWGRGLVLSLPMCSTRNLHLWLRDAVQLCAW